MTSVKRVALVLASSAGGVGRHVAALAAGLGADGLAVTVCGPAATEAMFGFSATGARFVPVEIPASPRITDANAVRALRTVLHPTGHSPDRVGPARDVDVIHAHGLRAGMVAALARPATCPLVVTWHNLSLARGVRGMVYRRLEQYVARTADLTFGVSSDLVARVRELGGRNVRHAAVPAPPLRPPTRTAAQIRKDLDVAPSQPLIFAAGRLHPQKGYDLLVAAAARLRDRRPRPQVVVAGDGPSRGEITKRIAAVRAPVRLLGHRVDIPNLLAAADIVVSTSVWEGQPLFVQEALRSGAPLVATAVGGVPDVVGDAALLVPGGDVDAMTAGLCALIDDPALRGEYARRGPRRAMSWPTPRDAVVSVERAYGEVCAAMEPN